MQQWCYRWLMACGLGHGLLGLGFIGFMASPASAHYVAEWALRFETGVNTQATVAALQFLGPTIASWGLMFCTALQGYWLIRASILWVGMILAIGVWLVFDTGLSAWYGLTSHYVINAFAALVLLLPLWQLRQKIPSSHTG
ncbi:hypothetical protein L1F30_10875 [Simiduia sp. 21SJ11W-1]|uniref:hypothetical protein n=1 Tax=Simiduia sp. 21SJ11W-1 TaxID=2909669 RepID=UPI00209FDD82|nr:hypothetical protein [Simiduia sp. 21SJ11W-1]UTA46664.1 hypothetical protein L1F30_10875 [Simiduia sp. 21SJ11W-1]